MSHTGELICRQLFRIKEHSFLWEEAIFAFYFKKIKMRSSLNLT